MADLRADWTSEAFCPRRGLLCIRLSVGGVCRSSGSFWKCSIGLDHLDRLFFRSTEQTHLLRYWTPASAAERAKTVRASRAWTDRATPACREAQDQSRLPLFRLHSHASAPPMRPPRRSYSCYGAYGRSTCAASSQRHLINGCVPLDRNRRSKRRAHSGCRRPSLLSPPAAAHLVERARTLACCGPMGALPITI